MAHLFHNCATNIKSHCEDVDQLIAQVKSATVKNKTRQAKFATVGYPPQLVVTRRGSWLNAALYYAKNFPEMKAFVESFERSVILGTQQKLACKQLI